MHNANKIQHPNYITIGGKYNPFSVFLRKFFPSLRAASENGVIACCGLQLLCKMQKMIYFQKALDKLF